ncbi:MAG TPA: glutamate racemase [Candidatus Kapabacteria bacterium]|jgi:glutamate racemase|nr:glutamate racemase [Candidatus Kapabacteria bacterium]
MSDKPIGVFDSGIGGMTVVKELFTTVPQERIVYFGDTARLPYGTKSVETVQRYAREDTELLLAQDVKLIVVACNTVSATALGEVERLAHGIPVIGMIEPCAEEAVRVTKTGHIGIIGTEATIASKAYETLIEREARRQSKPCFTISLACPLFVPLAEEGWTDHAATRLIAKEYLKDLKQQNIDTLILGCTHYPVLNEVIQEAVGPHVTLVNSGAAAAKKVSALLGRDRSQSTVAPEHVVLVSDVPRKFQKIGERFLGRPLPEARQVVWKESWVVRREPIE